MKRRKSFLSFILILSMSFGFSFGVMAKEKETGKVITVEYPGEGEDASPAIQKAIEKAKRVKNGVTIRFEEGKQYEVWPETAYHTTGYYISNSATQSENPNGERWSALLLKDMENVTIDGNGSMIMVHGVMTPVIIDGCENITFKNFSLDYVRPTVSEFTVLEKTNTNVKIKIHEDSYYEIKDNNIFWIGENKKSNATEKYWGSYATLMQEYDPENETLRRISNLGYGESIEDLGNNELLLHFPNGSSYKEGCTYQVRDGIRNQVGTFIHRSNHVKFKDCNFYYMHGLGIVGQYSENLTFDNINCAPRKESGRTCASFADFVQMSGCKGDILIENSHFSGSHDDTFNIHGTHLRIVEINEEDRQIKVRFMQPQSWGFQAFDIGDEIEFINADTLVPYQKNVVQNFERLNNTDILLTLEDELPNNIHVNWDAVENTTYTPNVTIRNNVSEYVPTRGVLCTTRGKVIIEGNTFKKQGMSAILLEDDARGWFESGLIRDMTIQNNRFEDCVQPQIHSNPQMVSADPEKTVHSNISILNNEFIGQAVNLTASGTKNLVIENNQFPESGGSIYLNGCNGFAINNNSNQKKIDANNSVNDKSIDRIDIESVLESEEISREGMTAVGHNEWPGDGGSNPPFPASYLLDGNETTFWSTDWNDVPEDDIYVEVDLNGEKTFNQIAWTPRKDDKNARILAYEMYASDRNGEYKKISEGRWSAASERNYADFDTITTDKIKLVVKETSMSWDNRKVVFGAEMQFYNSKRSAGELSIGKKAFLKTFILGKTGMPADLTDAVFEFQSSNNSVAIIDNNGVITGKGAGTTEITVKVSAYGKTVQGKVEVTVTENTYVAAQEIKIQDVGKLVSGEVQLQAKVTPLEAVDDVRWKIESSSNGARVTIDEQTGLLKMKGEGRVTVKAYSVNDPEIADSKEILFTEGDTSKEKWEWVRENPSNWIIDEKGNLNVTLEKAAIWAENSAKNILLTSTETGDFEAVTKMLTKPQFDYTEYGIIAYVDDENYVVLSRKVHPGYRPGEKNIFSLIVRKDGAPWESPAEKVVNDDAGDEVYLKLKKTEDSYSGYFSNDSQSWTPIFENKEVLFDNIPKVGLIGYVAGEKTEQVIYDEFSVDGADCSFEELRADLIASNAKITSIAEGNTREVILGTVFDKIRLPKTVNVTWNERYEESVPVIWDDEGFEANKVGTYQIYGELQGVCKEAVATEDRPTIQIVVTADKKELARELEKAESKLREVYTEATWNEFVKVYEQAMKLMEDKSASQEKVKEMVQSLDEKMNALERVITYAGMENAVKEADEILNQTNGKLYEEQTEEDDRRNGWYSKEKASALIEEKGKMQEWLKAFEELKELGDVDEFLNEEEKSELTKLGSKFIESLEDFQSSKVIVETESIQILLKDVQALIESDFTQETWSVLQKVVVKVNDILKSGEYTVSELKSLESELADAIAMLRRIYTIEILEKEGGTVTSDPSGSVVEGGRVVFTIKTSEGYELKDFYVNKRKMEVNDEQYILEGATENITASAIFEKLEEDKNPDGKPDDGENNPDGGDSGSDQGKTDGEKENPGGGNLSDKTNKAPKTGDESYPRAIFWIGMMVVSLGVIGMGIIRRKRS